jgi:hypothetical protein
MHHYILQRGKKSAGFWLMKLNKQNPAHASAYARHQYLHHTKIKGCKQSVERNFSVNCD